MYSVNLQLWLLAAAADHAWLLAGQPAGGVISVAQTAEPYGGQGTLSTDIQRPGCRRAAGEDWVIIPAEYDQKLPVLQRDSELLPVAKCHNQNSIKVQHRTACSPQISPLANHPFMPLVSAADTVSHPRCCFCCCAGHADGHLGGPRSNTAAAQHCPAASTSRFTSRQHTAMLIRCEQTLPALAAAAAACTLLRLS